MKTFKNIKQAHYYFNFPGSYRQGAIINNKKVIRIYSNTKLGKDRVSKKKDSIYYKLKNDRIKEYFLNTKKNDKKVKVFYKNLEKNNVEYLGLFNVIGIRQKEFVFLQK